MIDRRSILTGIGGVVAGVALPNTGAADVPTQREYPLCKNCVHSIPPGLHRATQWFGAECSLPLIDVYGGTFDPVVPGQSDKAHPQGLSARARFCQENRLSICGYEAKFFEARS